MKIIINYYNFHIIFKFSSVNLFRFCGDIKFHYHYLYFGSPAPVVGANIVSVVVGTTVYAISVVSIGSFTSLGCQILLRRGVERPRRCDSLSPPPLPLPFPPPPVPALAPQLPLPLVLFLLLLFD